MAERVVLVTGGARGIGRATGLLLAREGAAVAVGYRERRDEADSLVAEIEASGGRACAVQGDVAREDDVVAMFEAAEGRLGTLTGLVNSAGVSHQSLVADMDHASIERLMAVNVLGTIICCREAVRRMSTERGGAGGAIVNVSSMAAVIGGRPGASAHAASKGAVDVFTTGLAKEVGGEGIRVNVVRPGVTLTDMTDQVRRDPELRARVVSTIPMNRAAEASEIAEAIVWLLSDKASFISGAHINASGGGFIIGHAPNPLPSER
jgi:NAD(P)-dependent dehydrogenase (short-subunit alcohol dehydrogenase family)